MSSDLRAILHDPRLSQIILVESGSRKGSKIRGIFNLIYGDERLGRRSIETVSGEFMGLMKELDGIKPGDEILFKKDLFLVCGVSEGPNGARLDLSKKMVGHGRKT